MNNNIVEEYLFNNGFELDKLIEYNSENGNKVDTNRLIADPLAQEIYKNAHKGLVIARHEVYIEDHGAIVLAQRIENPVIGQYRAIGGRIQRGMSTEDSLRKTIDEKLGLQLGNMTFIGDSREFFETDPFGLGRGTDTITLSYLAKGCGVLPQDKNLFRITPEKYFSGIRNTLDNHTIDCIDKILGVKDDESSTLQYPIKNGIGLRQEDVNHLKEYFTENNHKIDINKLLAQPLDKETYVAAQKGLVIPCHDVYISYNDGFMQGILLVNRIGYPAINTPWPIGGRIQRGMTTEDSVKKKAKEECNLDLYNIVRMEPTRTFFQTDPFNHGRGTDTTAFVYLAEGHGRLNLNNLHESPMLITPELYNSGFRDKVHPYVQHYMDKIMHE